MGLAPACLRPAALIAQTATIGAGLLEMLAQLVARLDRRLSFALSVSDGHLYFTLGEDTFSGAIERHPVGAG